MVFYVLGILSVVTFGLCTGEKLTLPVTTCKQGSPKYHTCLKSALEEAWPRFVEGLPEFDFPRLDPLFLKNMSEVFETNEIYGEAEADNINIIGMKNLSFEAVQTHFVDVFHLTIDIFIPKIILTAYVKAKGSLFGMSMNAQGYINAVIEDIKAGWEIIGPVVNDTWVIEDFRITARFKKVKLNINDPTETYQNINDLISSFINNYWPSIYRIIGPTLFETFNTSFTDICNNLFSKVSFSAVFP